jgi:hypothetical protein
MADRKLALSGLLQEDIPERAGENLLLVRWDRHPGKFRQVLAFACQLLEQANPGVHAARAVWPYKDGDPVACPAVPRSGTAGQMERDGSPDGQQDKPVAVREAAMKSFVAPCRCLPSRTGRRLSPPAYWLG